MWKVLPLADNIMNSWEIKVDKRVQFKLNFWYDGKVFNFKSVVVCLCFLSWFCFVICLLFSAVNF
jgi:hypothetical protein